jgi:hypothetical protein
VNPITNAIPAALDPTTWDWGQGIVIPIVLALLTTFGRYLFLSTPSRSARRITNVLELKAKVPEADHEYLEPAYKHALRRYLQRSLNAQMPFSYKLLNASSFGVLAYFWLFLGFSAWLALTQAQIVQICFCLLIASFAITGYGLSKDLVVAARLTYIIRMRGYWDKAGWYYRSRAKVGRDTGMFKPWAFVILIAIASLSAGVITWLANGQELRGALAFGIAGALIAISWYFTALRMFFLAFKPGSKRHVLISLMRTFVALGLALVPAVLLLLAALIAST